MFSKAQYLRVAFYFCIMCISCLFVSCHLLFTLLSWKFALPRCFVCIYLCASRSTWSFQMLNLCNESYRICLTERTIKLPQVSIISWKECKRRTITSATPICSDGSIRFISVGFHAISLVRRIISILCAVRMAREFWLAFFIWLLTPRSFSR